MHGSTAPWFQPLAERAGADRLSDGVLERIWNGLPGDEIAGVCGRGIAELHNAACAIERYQGLLRVSGARDPVEQPTATKRQRAKDAMLRRQELGGASRSGRPSPPHCKTGSHGDGDGADR